MTPIHDRAVDPDDATIFIDRGDAAALIGLLATIEGHAQVGDLSTHAIAHLQRRLAADLSMDPSTPLNELLNMLNQRLRRALGEPV
jgi:hypothetical protein